MHYLFWVGFDLLGGATLRLVSADLLPSFILAFILFPFVEKEESEGSSNLLDSIRPVGRRWWADLWWWILMGKQIKMEMRMKPKKHTRAATRGNFHSEWERLQIWFGVKNDHERKGRVLCLVGLNAGNQPKFVCLVIAKWIVVFFFFLVTWVMWADTAQV